MGLLISVEGGEYTGKTSLVVPSLCKIFSASGIDARSSREPGGSVRGEKMRTHIFKKLQEGINPYEQALLFNKARKIHIEDTIKPYLGKNRENNSIMVIDRYLDSTRIYQGLEGKVDMKILFEMEKKYVDNFLPDVTLILYFPTNIFYETLLDRIKTVNEHRTRLRDETPFDSVDIEHHFERQKLYLGLPDIAKRNKETRSFLFINSAQRPYEVIKDIIKKIEPYICPIYTSKHALRRNLKEPHKAGYWDSLVDNTL